MDLWEFLGVNATAEEREHMLKLAEEALGAINRADNEGQKRTLLRILVIGGYKAGRLHK